MTLIVRRATPKDAAGFARMMDDPAIYSGLMQMPYTNAELWAAKGYVLEFACYGVRSVRGVADPVAESDFTIEGSLDGWTDMVRNIQDHGEPDLDHTLNRLTMAGVPLKVVAKDQLEIDIFYRFNQSLQAYFNEAAALPTGPYDV